MIAETLQDGGPAPLLLDVRQVAELTALSVRTVWRYVAAGTFPEPITISGRLQRWRYSDVVAWVDDLDGYQPCPPERKPRATNLAAKQSRAGCAGGREHHRARE